MVYTILLLILLYQAPHIYMVFGILSWTRELLESHDLRAGKNLEGPDVTPHFTLENSDGALIKEVSIYKAPRYKGLGTCDFTSLFQIK